jgi:hypothetical protein
MYTHCYILMQLFSCIWTVKGDIIELLMCCWCWCELFHLVLHVYSRLTTEYSSVDGTVYRCLHTLPAVTVWHGCPRFGVLAWSSNFTHAYLHCSKHYHKHIHCYKHCYKHNKAEITMYISLTTLFWFYSRGSFILAGPNISVGNK